MQTSTKQKSNPKIYRPAVSVIIPCYNQAQYLKECLDSVMNQIFQDFEVIVVDDGSTSPDSKKTFKALNYPKTRIIRQKNEGPMQARNHGISLAKSKYIYPLDADDKISPVTLEKSVKILNENPDGGIVGGRTELFGAKSGLFKLPPYHFPEILGGNRLVCSCMFRRADWEKVGGYNPNMKYGLEDYDFWLSLIEMGRKVYQFDDVFLYYRQSEISRTTKMKMEKNKQMLEQIVKNHPKLYQQHPFYKMILLDDWVIKIIRRLVKILCLVTPVKSWRRKLRNLYRKG